MAERTTATERSIREREKRSRKAYQARTRKAERAAVLAAEERAALDEAEDNDGAEPTTETA